jgi:hypothetical protein
MKYSFLAMLFLGAAFVLFADDGSWSDSRGYTPAEGALYSEAGNPAVSLEKEYLELSDYEAGSTRAVFQFRNTSKAPVTIECAFPVRIEWYVVPIKLGLDGKLTEESGPSVERGWDFGGAGKYSAQAKGPYREKLDDWLSVLGIPSRSWEPEDPDGGGEFISEADYPTGRRDLPPDAFIGALSLSVSQDGKKVPVTACVVDYGDEPGMVSLHFRHRLAFAANAVSRVEVRYALPAGSSASGDPMSPGYTNRYSWKYVLETGASWKGPIGSLVLAVPPGFSGELPSAFKSLGAVGSTLLFKAEAWEPQAGQNLDLSWSESVLKAGEANRIWLTSPRILDVEGESSVQEGLKIGAASSFAPDKADAYIRSGLLRQADFSPRRLFDGLRETCWVEGKADDGIGEYASFSIDRPMCMAIVQNGYLRSPVDIPEKATWSYFEKNNRVKTLEIRREGGAKVASLDLADTRELQRFALDLPPGSYRAVIAAVYPGSKWRDTCLGELSFIPGSSAELPKFKAEPFFSEFLAGK